ncbi:MAG TPA: hypothetical protein VGF38_10440 [Ktedonobacterales bacterium]|jgi:hypothetical protein
MRTSAYRWETQEVLIPLAFSVIRWPNPDYVGAATPRAQTIIAARLAIAADEGWRADEPTDFPTLFSSCRVRSHNTLLRWRVDSVTIRMTRRVPYRRIA